MRRAIPKVSVGYHLMLWAFAFDFKGEEGGSFAQFAFLALTLSGAGMVLLNNLDRLPLAFSRHSILLGSVIALGAAMAMLRGVHFDRMVRVALLYFLAFLAMTATYLECSRGVPRRRLLMAVVAPCFGSLVFRVVYAIFILGVPITEARFQIISPGTPFLIAYGCACILLEPVLRGSALVAFIASSAVVLLSITRTYAFSYLAIIAILGICYVQRKSRSLPWFFDFRKILRRICLVMLVTLIGFGIVSLIRPDFREHWLDRMFHQDVGGRLSKDLTYLTRLAEASGMIEILNESPLNYVVGMGYGHSFHWSGDALNEVYSTGMQFEEFRGDLWFSGHNMWLYALFATGSIGLLVMIYFIFGVIMSGLRILRQKISPEVLFSQLTALLAFVSFIAQAFVSNPFGERYACILLGVLAAVITRSDQFDISPQSLKPAR